LSAFHHDNREDSISIYQRSRLQKNKIEPRKICAEHEELRGAARKAFISKYTINDTSPANPAKQKPKQVTCWPIHLDFKRPWARHAFQIAAAIQPIDMSTKAPADIDRTGSAEAVSCK
jgi:hypothetical protein